MSSTKGRLFFLYPTVVVALGVIAWLLAHGSAREVRDVAIAMALGFVLLLVGRRPVRP